jgi:hypothetical protein
MAGLTGRAPRRFRSLAPAASRRGELAAALGVAVLLAHLLFAQLTLVLAVAFLAVGRVSRWHRLWLAVPAFAGLAWVLAIGPARPRPGSPRAPDASGRTWPEPGTSPAGYCTCWPATAARRSGCHASFRSR